MSNVLCRRVTMVAFAVSITVLIGCGSSPSARFYLLNSLGDAERRIQPAAGERCYAIGVGPVKLAEYLDRYQIVTRMSPNELRLADFDHWAEPLGRNVSRVMAENLSSLLCTKAVVLYPWSGSISTDFRIEIEIFRLDGKLGENSTLEAQWFVFSGGDTKKLLVAKKSAFIEPSGGQEYQALVSAQSRAVGALSREIAEAIKTRSK